MISIASLMALPSSAQSRLWNANLLDPRDLIPGLDRNLADTALIRAPGPGSHAGWSGDASWLGVLHREDEGGKAEILSAGASQSLWARVAPGSFLSLDWTGTLDRNRRHEPFALDAGLGVERGTLGFTWRHSVFGEASPAADRPFLDAAVRIPDRRRASFSAMLAGGVAGRWRVELGLVRQDAAEDAQVVNLDTAGNGETVQGLYKVRVEEHRLVVKSPIHGGDLSVLGSFGWSRPRRPETEFWFCDSSRSLRGRAAYRRGGEASGGWAWRAWGDFREGEAISLGRRIPPGSEGVKRFHYARNHAVLFELGGQGGTEIPDEMDRVLPEAAGGFAWRAGGLYRRLEWSSNPPDEALDSRRETLSYNRLGLSFIANLYGGLYKLSEVVRGDVSLGLLEANGAGIWRLGPATAEAGLALWRARVDAEVSGETLSQRLVVVDTSAAFRKRYGGQVLGATPRLMAALDFRSLRLEAEAAQALPLWSDVGSLDGPGGEGGAGADRSRHALFRNGFEAHARLVAGF